MSQIQITGLVVLVLLAGFFAGITVAFTRINKLKIEIKRKQGKLAGRILSRFTEQPGHFISISLVGLTITLVVYCILVGGIIRSYLITTPLGSIPSPYLRLVIEIIVAAAIMLIFGLLIPRSLFRAKADKLLVVLALPISLFSHILNPFSKMTTGISVLMLKYLFNVMI
jgi:CBS domain containing-hemolysin-like protein